MNSRQTHSRSENSEALGPLLQAMRERAGLTQRQLATKLQVSAPRLSQWEHGRRRPDVQLVPTIAKALNLSHRAEQELRAAVDASWGQRLKLHGLGEQIVRQIGVQLAADDVTAEHKKKLIDGMGRTLRAWQAQRVQHVSAIVVPVAGWQADLLSDEQSARLIRTVVHEAKAVSLKKLVVVVAPRQRLRLVQRLRSDARLESLKIVEVIQERPEGLGSAIRLTEPTMDDGEAFLLSFPDERVLPSYTTRLLEAHRRTQRNVVAVRPSAIKSSESVKREGHPGGVVLDAEADGDAIKIRRLEEKPTPQTIRKSRYTILGRYVLNAEEIFAALREIPPNERTKKLELTDALNQLARDGEVIGVPYELRGGRMRSLRVPRQLMGKALDEFLAALE